MRCLGNGMEVGWISLLGRGLGSLMEKLGRGIIGQERSGFLGDVAGRKFM